MVSLLLASSARRPGAAGRLSGARFDPLGRRTLVQVRQFGFTCREEVRILRRWLAKQPAGIILDLACGAGGPGRVIADGLVEYIVGVDLAGNALRRATDDLRSVALTGGYVVADAG